MRFKRILSFVASAAMTISALCGAMSITASAASTGSLTWEVVNNDTLKITVTSKEPGATATMPDYKSNGAPWYSSYRTKIKKIEIGAGVTSIGDYAFVNLSSATDLVLPTTMKTIGQYAFQNCSVLANLSFVDEDGMATDKVPQLTTVETYAFNNCSKLKNVPEWVDTSDILKSATTIDSNAFNNCGLPLSVNLDSIKTLGERAFYSSGIKSLKISSRELEVIPQYAFSQCSNLETMTLPTSGLTEIAGSAFQGCSSIKSISIPSTVKTLGSSAFSGCSAATSISLPSTQPTFASNVFANCTSLEQVKIPSSYTEITDSMFYGCSSLNKVTFQGTSVTKIANSAFYGCGFTSFEVPDSVTTIGNNAFDSCKTLETVTLKHGLKEIGNNAFKDCAALIAPQLPNTVTSLGEKVFLNCTGFVSVTIPSSITAIPNSAFSGCTNLASIDFPDNVESIGEKAFENCTSLKSITLPKNLTSVTGQAFTGCTSLTTIKAHEESKVYSNPTSGSYTGVLLNADKTEIIAFPLGNTSSSITFTSIASTITKIGDYAFYSNTKISSLTFTSIKEIGNYAFNSCTNIGSVSIPDSVVTIGNYAFDGDTKISSLTLSSASALESIGDYAFRNTKITQLTLPAPTSTVTDNNKLKNIGSYAFYGCTSLKTITLQSNSVLETIGDSAFSGCRELTGISLPDTVTSIGISAFYNCAKLTSAKLSNSLTEIPKTVFRGCTVLKSVNVPNSVTSIGDNAFYDCKALTDIEVPNSVQSLGINVFQNCTALEKAVIGSGITTLPANAFFSCTNPELEIYLVGKITSITTNNTFGSATASYVKGTIYVTDDTSYTTISKATAVTTANNATLKYSSNLTELKNVLEKARSLYAIDYTPDTFSAFESALLLAENTAANYLSTSGQASITANNLQKAIDALVVADNSEMLAQLQETVEHAENDYVRTDYRELSFLDLRKAYQAGGAVTGDELNSELKALIDAIENAEKNLVVNYAYGDPVMTVRSGTTPVPEKHSYNNDFHYLYPCMEGIVTPDLVGATQVKVKFQMAPTHANFNGATKMSFKCYIEGTDANGAYTAWNTDAGDVDKTQIKTGSYSNPIGGTHELTYDIIYANGVTDPGDGTPQIKGTPHDNALGENEVYRFYFWTEDWNHYPAYDYIAFYTLEVQLLDAEGNVLRSTKDVIVPNEDLKAAIAEADAADKTGASEESIQALTDAVDAANAVLEEEKPLPSVMESSAQAIRDAIKALSGGSVTPGVDKTALNEAISNAEGMDTSAYTDESVAALKTAIDNAKTVAANESATDEDVAAAVKAIEDAIAALAEKPGDDKVDKTELNNEIKTAEDMDTSAYTDESVAALQTAIDSAKTVAANENATKEDVDAAVKAIKDAVAALAKKPSGSDSSNNPSDSSGSGNPSGSNNPSVTTPTAAPTTAAPAKRSAQQVAKDKAAAQAKVSQAKITKLTVKSKAKKKINVTWKKVKKAVGYQVQVSTKKNFKKIIFNKFTAKKKLIVTKKIKSKKTYYVRVRAYATYKDVNNVTKKVYSKWNKKLRKVKVK